MQKRKSDIVQAMKDLIAFSMTQTYPYHINDTSAHTIKNGYAIQALEDTTFTTLQASNIDGNAYPGSETLLAGHTIYVKVNGTVTLATGSIMVYRTSK